jgi:hypothetical protein
MRGKIECTQKTDRTAANDDYFLAGLGHVCCSCGA